VLRTGAGSPRRPSSGDILKGTAAVVIAGYLWRPNAAMLAALAPFLGHLFPVWLKFKGGKGVAVYMRADRWFLAGGSYRCCGSPPPFTTRYSSLSALVASFVTRIFLLDGSAIRPLASLFAVLTMLLFIHDRDNIKAAAGRNRGAIGEEVAGQLFRLSASSTKVRGCQRFASSAKSGDDLHAHRQSAVGDVGGNIDAGTP